MTPEEFEVGKLYFSCGFMLRFRPVPLIESAVFLGKNIYGQVEGGDFHYFQEPGAYFREELNFEAIEHGERGYSDEDGDGIFTVPSDCVSDYATDLKGLQDFVQKLPKEPNASDLFGSKA